MKTLRAMALNIYQKTAITTVIATLVLILIGGLVRASGAGLGCPDWPTCFGLWIPPFSADMLPAGYDAAQFNVFHTWLEYINRLAGVLIGVLITITSVLSFRYRRTDPVVTIVSCAAFLLVLVQGWLGGKVVESGLSSGMITVHMLLAMIIVNTLLFAAFRAARGKINIRIEHKTARRIVGAGLILLTLTLVQMILGTQVRESIDVIKNAADPIPRQFWIESIHGWIYSAHRSSSWVILLTTGVLLYLNRRWRTPPILEKTGYLIAILVVFQVLLGVGMEYLDIPALFQLLHLVGFSLLICTEFLSILIAGFSTNQPEPGA